MKHTDAFSACHPLVNFLYFAAVIGFSMVLMHPLALAISLLAAVSYAIVLDGRKALAFGLRSALPLMLGAALLNPAFSHGGFTILCYLPSGNPLTLESIVYGVAAATMLAAVLLWFRCYTQVMTSDKFVYLFGRVIPAMSLVLSMTLRFVPKFKRQMDAVRQAQRNLGRDVWNGSLWQRMKSAVTVFSVTVTWSLENAIETADSMKSRGYGLPGRTAFSIYRMDDRDKGLILWLSFLGVYLLSGTLAGGLRWRYYPSIKGVLTQPFTVSFLLAYTALCLTPVLIHWREERKWRSLRSGI